MIDHLWMETIHHVVKINAIGDKVKFMFLEMLNTIVFLDITSKQAENVYEMMPCHEIFRGGMMRA
jgi:hypothetical protein